MVSGPPIPHPARHRATPISGTGVVWRAGCRNTVIVAFVVQNHPRGPVTL